MTIQDEPEEGPPLLFEELSILHSKDSTVHNLQVCNYLAVTVGVIVLRCTLIFADVLCFGVYILIYV